MFCYVRGLASHDEYTALAQGFEANKRSGHTLRTTSLGLTFTGCCSTVANKQVRKQGHKHTHMA